MGGCKSLATTILQVLMRNLCVASYQNPPHEELTANSVNASDTAGTHATAHAATRQPRFDEAGAFFLWDNEGASVELRTRRFP